ncbi:rhomboid family intramembrane serine protease [Marinomonas sp. M1K-6]|uniref:Rhomboid family intramembrane serine protease n=1 Tax=Marinomonas profundi TaxID=2726122 RepID=A0A847R341_9GAMM|nr:rhomboid family intramembrane serine protease [Marinomonas profundi]NLQ16336.1 rhomboid family intramembrane serine protease [Marinomonas profundi]UDV03089.1 rhomboid family intramembrane serine protease [Marinomonas profundi]
MYFVYQFKETEDPKGLSEALWRHKVAHQIIAKQGSAELWVLDPGQLPAAEQLISIWQDDPALLQQAQPAAVTGVSSRNKLFSQLKIAPVTSLLLLLTLLVALITQLGADIKTVGYFAISPFDIRNGHIYFYDLAEVFSKGEYWRFFTPALLHFSVLHLIFNTLWVWDIGRKLEGLLGSMWWSIGVVIIAVLSNVLQYQISAYPLFGGLSGVVYGLIGFAWLLPILSKRWPTIISKPLMVFFTVWLAIGYTPFPEMLGLGSIANTAHSIGLLSGLVLGVVYWLATKHRQS